MFKNYFKTAFRSLLKNKATSIINVLGLSIGICAALIIFLIIKHENSFDKWEPDNDRIFRIFTQYGPKDANSGIPMVAPKEINSKITGIDVVAHFINQSMDDATIEIPNGRMEKSKTLNATPGIVFADDNYFKIFPTKWTFGNPTSLEKLNNVVLSESIARKFFPNMTFQNIMGKTIVFNDSIQTIVSGIVSDDNRITDFNNNIFISLKTLTETGLETSLVGTPGWTNINGSSQCLVKINDGANVKSINRQLKQLFTSNITKESNDFVDFGILQPLSNIHLNTMIDGESANKNNRNIILLGIVILLLASINFVNLTTAQSSLRAKEIGVRKTFGSDKRQIIVQFLSETFLLMLVSSVLACVLYPALFQLFKGFIPQTMKLNALLQVWTLFYLLGLILILTFLAGLYPALVMSNYKPIQALKGKIIHSGKSEKVWLRQSLIVFQFVVAQVFLIIVFVISKQIHYVLNKDMGFKKNAIVSFYTPEWRESGTHKNINILYNEIKNIPGIRNASIASGTPAFNGFSTTSLSYGYKGKIHDLDYVHLRNIDDNYIDVFGLTLLAGKNVRIDTSAKIPDVLINETLMKQVGFTSPNEAIGKYLMGGNADSSIISGVVKDFNIMSLTNSIKPMILFANDFGYANKLSINFRSNNVEDWKKALKDVEFLYSKLYVGKTFDYQFYDKTIESLYSTQIRLNTLLKCATGLSIFISCMGLIGLVMFLANQRTKEIGIRKVLGASIPQILSLLSKNLVRLIVLASVISFPIAWYYSHSWLADFAYKTTLSWWIFPICAIGMLLTALLIVWTWSMKAAKSNPAEILRTE
ncbi:ABC transporter permease [Rhizosphaericola mali]|uniref:FtsX-like permease family protein n=1 Tax=Rhizosphaericola mali TaxID=2545455 RepID=A0A5P2FZY0_9BACT|nr:ABC transporter permease [Rhizosphaericola mali]QES89094.1 FtsX-like permease family protein [Rhizosphaericola mali]